MLLPSAVHVSSTFAFGAMFQDLPKCGPSRQSSILPLFFGAPCMLLPSAVHVSSTFEFGAMFHDCLSPDPQGYPPFSPLFFRSPMNVIA